MIGEQARAAQVHSHGGGAVNGDNMNMPVAAIDVGSNSVRVAVIRADCEGHLDVIEEANESPRLIRDVQTDGKLSTKSIDHIVTLMRDYQSIARGAGAGMTVAVATSAVRDAQNADDLVNAVRDETGIELRVISGEEEARFAFLGSVHSLPVDNGMVLDIGGGSLEILRFQDRRVVDSWTLPLGAVRLSDTFLKSDPPTQQELRACRKHIRQQIVKARIPKLQPGGTLVGTGGTVRNLAKIDRARRRYPITRLHAYVLDAARLRLVSRVLRSRKVAVRASIDGLNSDRADTIVAGALAVQTVMQLIEAESLIVSGQGLREGIAFSRCESDLPAVEDVRRVAVDDMLGTFARGRRDEGERRARIANALIAGGIIGDGSVEEMLRVAARLIDVGRSVDYYSRHRHAEHLILMHGLACFSHNEHALLCGMVRLAGEPKYSMDAYSAVLSKSEREAATRAGAILALADDLERRIPPEARVDYSASSGRLTVHGVPDGWEAAGVGDRAQQALGVALEVVGA